MSLAGVELADLSEAGVLGVVVGWQQVMDLAVAAQAGAITELVARRRVSSSFPADDVACALATTTHSAQALVARAGGLAAHPVLADALRAGVLDARKVDVLLDEVSRLPQAPADSVLSEVAADAQGLTAPLLRRETRRLVVAVDPEAAEKRAARARSDRCVRLEHGADAMAWVSALLPAPDAVAVYSVVDTLARAAEGEGDVRTLPQRRADVLSDVFATILASGVTPEGRRLPSRQGEALGLQLTMAVSTFTGADDMPGELEGYGPIPAALARNLADAASQFRPVLTDDAGHVLAVAARTHPVSVLRRRPAEPDGSGEPISAGSPLVLVGPAGLMSADAVPRGAPGCESFRDLGAASPPTVGEAANRADRTVGYRPYAALRRLVLARDGTCTFPGCRQPAAVCDLDHIEPFDHSRPPADQTRPENVQPLCRHHHLAKTHRGWTMRRDAATGDVHVTSPLGLEYVRLASTIVLTESAYRHGSGRRRPGRGPARTADYSGPSTHPGGGTEHRTKPSGEDVPDF